MPAYDCRPRPLIKTFNRLQILFGFRRLNRRAPVQFHFHNRDGRGRSRCIGLRLRTSLACGEQGEQYQYTS